MEIAETFVMGYKLLTVFCILMTQSIVIATNPAKKVHIFSFSNSKSFADKFMDIYPEYFPHEKMRDVLLNNALNALQKSSQLYKLQTSEQKSQMPFEYFRSRYVELSSKKYLGPGALLTWVIKGGKASVDAIQKLLSDGVDINSQDPKGRTALLLASIEGRLEIAQLLLARGAKINIAEKRGGTAFSAAVINGHSPIVELLLSSGERAHQTFTNELKGVTPLMLAAQFGHEGIVKLLIDHGAKIESTTPDRYKATALYQALFHNQLGVGRILASKGATFSFYRRKDGAQKANVILNACKIRKYARTTNQFGEVPCKIILTYAQKNQLNINEHWFCGPDYKICR